MSRNAEALYLQGTARTAVEAVAKQYIVQAAR